MAIWHLLVAPQVWCNGAVAVIGVWLRARASMADDVR